MFRKVAIVKRARDADQQYCLIKAVVVRCLYWAVVYYAPRKFNVVVQEFVQERRGSARPSLHRLEAGDSEITLRGFQQIVDRERSGGIDCALHLAVDEQLVQEFNRAFNRNSSGEKSAGLRWHERAVGRSWDDRWVRPIRLRGIGATARSKTGKRLHGEKCAQLFGI